MPIAKTSLCRFSQATHYKSRHWSPAPGDRNFMRERRATSFALCRPAGLPRNDVAPSPGRFRVIMPPRREKWVQGRQRAMRAIPVIVFLCTASAFGTAQAQPSVETIARGKALTEAADCASCCAEEVFMVLV